MKVMLINPQYKSGYIHSARWDGLTISNSHWYPIFLSYCTGLLENNGNICKLIDAEAEDLSDDEVFSIAKKFKPNFTIIYFSEKGSEGNINLAKRIKENTKSKIIFVGPWCSMNPKEILKSNVIDHLIDGEFEFAVNDIVKGKTKKRYIKSKRLSSEKLNELSWVTKIYKKHLDIKNYNICSLWYPFVDLFTGRKCYWGKCSFCLWPSTNLKEGGYITRDINDVLDEIEWAASNLDIKEIFIQDDTLPGWRAKQIAEGILKRDIKINWSAYARGDLSMTPEILRLMKKSGCHCLHVGYESGSNDVLKNCNKGVTKETLEKFTKWATDARIDIHGDFMIGLPGETEKTIKQTIEWAKKLNIVTYQFVQPKPYKCTPLYIWLKNKNILEEDGTFNYKDMSYSDMEKWCKKAMKECYFNRFFLRRVITKPNELKRVLRSGIYVIPHILRKGEE